MLRGREHIARMSGGAAQYLLSVWRGLSLAVAIVIAAFVLLVIIFGTYDDARPMTGTWLLVTSAFVAGFKLSSGISISGRALLTELFLIIGWGVNIVFSIVYNFYDSVGFMQHFVTFILLLVMLCALATTAGLLYSFYAVRRAFTDEEFVKLVLRATYKNQ